MLEDWLVDFVMSCFLSCIVKNVMNCERMPLITEFLTKEREFGLYWFTVETKEVYSKNRLSSTATWLVGT